MTAGKSKKKNQVQREDDGVRTFRIGPWRLETNKPTIFLMVVAVIVATILAFDRPGPRNEVSFAYDISSQSSTAFIAEWDLHVSPQFSAFGTPKDLLVQLDITVADVQRDVIDLNLIFGEQSNDVSIEQVWTSVPDVPAWAVWSGESGDREEAPVPPSGTTLSPPMVDGHLGHDVSTVISRPPDRLSSISTSDGEVDRSDWVPYRSVDIPYLELDGEIGARGGDEERVFAAKDVSITMRIPQAMWRLRLHEAVLDSTWRRGTCLQQWCGKEGLEEAAGNGEFSLLKWPRSVPGECDGWISELIEQRSKGEPEGTLHITPPPTVEMTHRSSDVSVLASGVSFDFPSPLVEEDSLGVNSRDGSCVLEASEINRKSGLGTQLELVNPSSQVWVDRAPDLVLLGVGALLSNLTLRIVRRRK